MSIKIRITEAKRSKIALQEGAVGTIVDGIPFVKRFNGKRLKQSSELKLTLKGSDGQAKSVNILEIKSKEKWKEFLEKIASESWPSFGKNGPRDFQKMVENLIQTRTRMDSEWQELRNLIDELDPDTFGRDVMTTDGQSAFTQFHEAVYEFQERAERVEELLNTLYNKDVKHFGLESDFSQLGAKGGDVRALSAYKAMKNARMKSTGFTRFPDGELSRDPLSLLERKFNDQYIKAAMGRNPFDVNRDAIDDFSKIKEINSKVGADDTIDTSAPTQLENLIDQIDDDTTRAFDRTFPEGSPQPKVNRIDKTEEFVPVEDATKEWNATPGVDAKPRQMELEEVNETLKLPIWKRISPEKKKKFLKYLIVAGLLVGAGAATFATIKKFMEGDSVADAAAEEGGNEEGSEEGSEKGSEEDETADTADTTTDTTTGKTADTTTDTTGKTTGKTTDTTTGKTGTTPTKAGGGACKDENEFRKLSAREKINCGVKNQRYIDFAKAYREARSLVGDIVESTVLDSDMLTDFRAKTQNKIDPDSIVKHILNQILPMRGILIRYGFKQIKKKDALDFAKRMDAMIMIAQDPSEQIIPFTLPPELAKTDDSAVNVSFIASFLKLIDKQINRKDVIRAIERALDEHLKPWTPISRDPVDFDREAARKAADSSKLPTKEAKEYDLDFSRWKKMFL